MARRRPRALARLGEAGTDLRRRLTPARRIPVTDIRYEYGFGFGDLYHPYTQVLACGDAEKGGILLGDFYDAFAPVLHTLPDWQALPVQAWRYGKKVMTYRLTERIPSAHFGWVPKEGHTQAKTRARYLFFLRDSISQQGFRRNTQPIDGVFVGQHLLLLGGQNRVAVLDNLSWSEVPVKNLPRKNTPKRVTPETAPLVVYGRLDIGDAHAIFARIQAGVTIDQARAWGLPFASNYS